MSNIDKRDIHNQQLKAFITGFLTDPAHDNQSPRSMTAEVFRIALASLEADPVAWRSLYYENHGLLTDSKNVLASWQKQGWECEPLYTAPPAPVVPDEMLCEFYEVDSWPDLIRELVKHVEQLQDSARRNVKPWEDTFPETLLPAYIERVKQADDACRAAMVQGADRPQNEPQNIPENIPATQFKPVADLYGLTSPTGGETSFTFDAVEARDFIDGGWSCQEYVELERFQEAITNHTEDNLDMVDHSGDSNNMVEPVTTACKLPEETGSSLQLRNLIRQRHAEWSQATFGDVGPVGPLKHLSKEALEAAEEPEDLSEWADMQFLLWDAQRRAGISDGEITAAMEKKLKVNMARQWPEPKDGEPRMHINPAPQQEV